MKVYSVKEIYNIQNAGFETNIVMKLIEPYLDCGRIFYVDNRYSSVELAELLQSRQTRNK